MPALSEEGYGALDQTLPLAELALVPPEVTQKTLLFLHRRNRHYYLPQLSRVKPGLSDRSLECGTHASD
jgi:hypothetical protein